MFTDFEKIKEDYLTFKVVSNTYLVVGERHMYGEGDHIAQTRSWQVITEAVPHSRQVLVEGLNDPQNDFWARMRGHSESFMLQAETIAKNNGIPVSELGDIDIDMMPESLKRESISGGAEYTIEQIIALKAIANFPLFLTAATGGSKLENLMAFVHSIICQQDEVICDIESILNITRLALVLNIYQELKEINVILEYVTQLRERMMQNRLVSLIQENDLPAFIIVGQNHVDGIANTLQDSTFRTPVTALKGTIFETILTDFYVLPEKEFSKKYLSF